MKRTIEALIFTAFGAMLGALAQAGAEMKAESQGREFCVPLYDQPGIERVQCDPVNGAR